MGYYSYVILPTQKLIKTFYEETLVLTDCSYELEYILAKLIELIDESHTLRGETPASHHWQEAFVTSVHYDGMADYYDVHQDKVFSSALRKLYRSVLTVFIQQEHLIPIDDHMVYSRLVSGDIILGLVRSPKLTPAEVSAYRRPTLSVGTDSCRH